MSETIIRHNDDGPPDIWEAIAMDYRQFMREEDGSHLGLLFAYWLDCRHGPYRMDLRQPTQFAGYSPPPEGSFDPYGTQSQAVVDVTPDNPYRFKMYAAGQQNHTVGDIPNPLFRRVYAVDFLMCKGKAHPFYSKITQSAAGVTAQYYRLLLPVQRDTKVSRVYNLMRPVQVETPELEMV